MRRILLLIFLLFLFLLGAGTFFYLRSNRSPSTDTANSGLPEQPYGYPIDQNGKIDKDVMYIIFRSNAKVREDVLTNLVTGEKIANVVLLEGYTKDSKGNPQKLNVIVQASFPENEENIYSLIMEDNIKIKGLQISTTKGNLSPTDIMKLFSKNSLWRVEADLKPLDPKNPLVDPSTEYFKLMGKVDEKYFSEINNFIASGLVNSSKSPIIPVALFPADLYQ